MRVGCSSRTVDYIRTRQPSCWYILWIPICVGLLILHSENIRLDWSQVITRWVLVAPELFNILMQMRLLFLIQVLMCWEQQRQCETGWLWCINETTDDTQPHHGHEDGDWDAVLDEPWNHQRGGVREESRCLVSFLLKQILKIIFCGTLN